jgi:hypothetical protein
MDNQETLARRVFKKIIRIRKSKERQHNDQKKKDKRTNNDLLNTTNKTKDRVTRTQPETRKQRVHLGACEGCFL